MNAPPLDAPDRTPLVPHHAMWLTWEHQRRNISIANALAIPLFEFDIKGNPLKRYVQALFETYRALRRERPALIFVQNPSLILTLATLAYGAIERVPVVVDAHNAALDRLGPGLLSWPSRLAARHARLTLVSNENLSAAVRAQGGQPFVLPDPLPDLPATNSAAPQPKSRRVMFVCTYAADEPYLAVLEAASRLEPARSSISPAIRRAARSSFERWRRPMSRSPGSCPRRNTLPSCDRWMSSSI